MANPSKRIGTEGENAAVEAAQKYFPDVERAPTNQPGNDLSKAFPVPTEIRRRKRWDLPGWARSQVEKFGDKWAIWLIPRDLRRKDAPPAMMVFPQDFALHLLKLHQLVGGFDDDTAGADTQ